MTQIIAGVHERPSGVPRLLLECGATVHIEPLRAGDYEVGGGAIVERKTVRGVHAAIIEGTFWPQVGRLRNAARFPYLLIEGTDLDNGPLRPAAIRGACIAVTDLGITLLRSTDASDSASWLYLLARRRSEIRFRNRPAYAQRPKREAGEAAAEAALSCVPGISSVSARALLDRFGSLAALVAADAGEWQLLAGIGPRKARALAETLHTSQPSSRSPRRGERLAPST